MSDFLQRLALRTLAPEQLAGPRPASLFEPLGDPMLDRLEELDVVVERERTAVDLHAGPHVAPATGDPAPVHAGTSEPRPTPVSRTPVRDASSGPAHPAREDAESRSPRARPATTPAPSVPRPPVTVTAAPSATATRHAEPVTRATTPAPAAATTLPVAVPASARTAPAEPTRPEPHSATVQRTRRRDPTPEPPTPKTHPTAKPSTPGRAPAARSTARASRPTAVPTPPELHPAAEAATPDHAVVDGESRFEQAIPHPRRRPTRRHVPAAVEPESTVHVSIGRIEIRAVAPTASADARERRPHVTGPSLKDYLRERAEGGR